MDYWINEVFLFLFFQWFENSLLESSRRFPFEIYLSPNITSFNSRIWTPFNRKPINYDILEYNMIVATDLFGNLSIFNRTDSHQNEKKKLVRNISTFFR